MAKRNLSKKPKRKQLSRKLKRKTLNRKKGGSGQTRYGSITIRTRHRGSQYSEEAGSLENICIGLLLFVIFILLPAAGLASRNSGGGEKFQLPEELEPCLIDKDRFNTFLQKVEINGNMLTINDLTNTEMTTLQNDVLLKEYIQGDTSSFFFDFTKIKIPLTEVIKSFINKLPRDNSVVDVDCINKNVSPLFT